MERVLGRFGNDGHATGAATARVRRAARVAVESLEARELLSVSQDSNGWTVVTPGANSHVYFVSSSGGNDFNNGLSEGAPLRTIAKAKSLMRSGAGDQMLLKRGDTFHETFGYWNASGAGASQPTVIGAYGAGPRPDVETGGGFAFVCGSAGAPVHDVAVIGIRFHSDGHDPSSPTFNDSVNPDGFSIVGGVSNLLIEDCSIEDYTNNLVFQDYFAPVSGIQIRRTSVLDSYADNGAHSQGMYAEGVDGILLEGDLFDHNGWNEGKAGAGATVFNHNVYVQARSDHFVARGNIFANASSHGLQARAGGTVQDNVFINNPIGMSYGLVNGSGPAHAGGAFGRVTDNVFMGGRDISGQPRGVGMEIANIAAGKGTSIDNNLFMNGVANGLFAAINVGYGVGVYQTSQVGVNDLTIKNNTIYNWAHGMFLSAGLQPGQNNWRGINRLTVTDNDFQNITGDWTVFHGYPDTPSTETWSNNRYGALDGKTGNYLDPGRTINTFDSSIGGPGTSADFLNKVRGQSSQAWSPQYTSRALITYLKGGYVDPTDPTPPTTPPPTYPPYIPPTSSSIPYIPPAQRPTPPQGGGGGGGGGGGSGGGGGGTGGGAPGVPDPFGLDGGDDGSGSGGTGTGAGGAGSGGAVGSGGSDPGAPALPPLPPGVFPPVTGGTGTGTGTGTGGTGTGTGGTGTGTGGTGTGTGGGVIIGGTGSGGTGTGTGGSQGEVTGAGGGPGGTGSGGSSAGSSSSGGSVNRHGGRASGIAIFYLPHTQHKKK